MLARGGLSGSIVRGNVEEQRHDCMRAAWEERNPGGKITPLTWVRGDDRMMRERPGEWRNGRRWGLKIPSGLIPGAGSIPASPIRYANGSMTRYHYDDLNRLTLPANTNGAGEVIRWYEYELGSAGNRKGVIESDGQDPVRTVEYDYDELYRLTGERIVEDPDDPDSFHRIFYDYDNVGNRQVWKTGRVRFSGGLPCAFRARFPGLLQPALSSGREHLADDPVITAAG